GEQLRVLARRRRLHVRGRVAAERGPQTGRHLPGLVEPLRGAQRDELFRCLRPEQVGKNPVLVVGVIYKQQQVTKTDEGIRAVGCALERVGAAMHITDHVHPHALTLGKIWPGAGTSSRPRWGTVQEVRAEHSRASGPQRRPRCASTAFLPWSTSPARPASPTWSSP